MYDSFTIPWIVPARFICPWDFPGKNTGWVAISFSMESSHPRDRICISCIGRWILTTESPVIYPGWLKYDLEGLRRRALWSWPQKIKIKMENVIQANLKIILITQKQPVGKLCWLEVKAQLCKFLRQRIIHQMTYCQFMQSRSACRKWSRVIMTPYQVKREGYLLRRSG